MSKQDEKREILSDVAAAFGAGFTKVHGDIGTAYQQVLLQNSPLSVQAAVDNAIASDRDSEQTVEPALPEPEPTEPDRD